MSDLRTIFVSLIRTKRVQFAFLVLLLLALPLIIFSQSTKQSTASLAATKTTAASLLPPAQVCGNTSLLSGPANAPEGAVIVPAGDNSMVNFGQTNTTYWFAPGVHTLGNGQFDQIIPGNNAMFIGAPGAVIDGQKKNQYAFTQHATGVTIKYLTIQNFGAVGNNNNEGVVNHDAGQSWNISYNTIQDNAGAGVFIGSNDTISYNCLTSNEQYGFSAYDPNGVSNIILDHNEISDNDTYNWEAKSPGCGCTGGGKFWATTNATITYNYIHNNHSVGLWADTNNTGFAIENNYIADNYSEGIIYEISYNALIKNNTFLNNAWGSGPTNPGFPTGAIYLSESGSDSRVPGNYGTTLDVTGNLFQDNWGGVILWENANRFCSSDANTSTGTCTLVNPTVATLTTCANDSLRATTPYINDCRWKTQNVNVTNNTFNFNPNTIGATCTVANSCGFNGIFSQYGSYAPYTAWKVPQDIANNQNNIFANNTYVGPWNFMNFNQGDVINWSQWTAGFTDWNGSDIHVNGQDAGSTFNSTGAPTTTPDAPTPTQIIQPTDTPILQPTPTTFLPTATPSPASNGNILDSNTSGLEGSLGKWENWYSATISRSTLAAHSGNYSLQIKVTAPYGWGVQLSNWPGFAITPGQKTISFWGLQGNAKSGPITMNLQWLNTSGKTLQTSTVVLPLPSSTWQQAAAVVNAPTDTKSVFITITGNSNKGTALYLDDITISQ